MKSEVLKVVRTREATFEQESKKIQETLSKELMAMKRTKAEAERVRSERARSTGSSTGFSAG